MPLFTTLEAIKPDPEIKKAQLERGSVLAERIGGLTVARLEYTHDNHACNSLLERQHDRLGFRFLSRSDQGLVDYEPSGCMMIQRETGQLEVSLTPSTNVFASGHKYDTDHALGILENTVDLYESAAVYGPPKEHDLCTSEGLVNRVSSRGRISVLDLHQFFEKDEIESEKAQNRDYVFDIRNIEGRIRGAQ